MEKRTLPTLDLKRHYAQIKEEIDGAIRGVVESQYFVLGPEVKSFENEVANYLEVKHAVGCASGSDALLLDLMALDVGPGDEVITTPFTFFATVSAITRLGATPVFADIDPKSYNLDPAEVLKKITPRTKVFMPVHLFGQMVEMEKIAPDLKSRGVHVVEDCAQAFGAWREAGGKIVRCGGWGGLGAFSFFPTKNLGAYGDGGMVTTNDDAQAERLSRLRVHGAGTTYFHDEVGLNSRLDALQAAILRVHLRHLDECIEERRRIADRYRMLFAERELGEFVTTPHELPGNYHTYHQYVIRAQKRDELMDFLAAEGIVSRVYYPLPLHLQKCFAFLGGRRGDYPESERLAEECLALPIFPGLTMEEQQWTADTIAKFYK
ncbi:DegT/DnrJ/EryC1/StrS family aminotransferase [Pyramidobacter piscolens]|uniref:DegT/DnrJ/EryC1/StrS family aminotransferase n=1 Tax=Pyramidobacter piscolens TaxID=638849 RepID=UPI003AB781DF